MREIFYNKLNDLASKKRHNNSFFLSAENYKFSIKYYSKRTIFKGLYLGNIQYPSCVL